MEFPNQSTHTYRLLFAIGIFWLLAMLVMTLGTNSVVVSILFMLVALPLSTFLLPGKIYFLKSVTLTLIVAGIFGAFLCSAFISAIESLFALQFVTIEDFSQLKPKTWILTFFSLLAVHGIHLTLFYIRTSFPFTRHWHKILFYGLLIGTIAILEYKHPSSLAIIFLAGGVYALLLDLFVDTPEKDNVIWLILWTIILGSIITICINASALSEGVLLPMVNALSIFSISFVGSVMLYASYALINRKHRFLPESWNFYIPKRKQLHNRIQLSILLTLVFSFVTIGFVSIYQFNAILPQGGKLSVGQLSLALFNTYVFLFLIGFGISYVLAEYIRNPLLELGRTLKNVKLNKQNQKIAWAGDDEIAGLIAEYNSMIDKLAENTQLLTQVERDNAWREMAKQVAHEIKNPLTPMKLSLQYLEKSIQYKREDIESLALRMCDTLKKQVDNLQQIADTFATFGSLPKTDNQKVNLNQIMEAIHDLFRNREDMDIQLIEPIDDIDVYADKNQLLRVLNNLVKNSIQAIPEGRKGIIELKLWKEDNKAIIEVADNGCGISKEEQKMIFKPKFTTKTSGSGLGLAISANIIDSMGGTIYFKSEANKNCHFYVELPLIRYEFNKTTNRVLLED